MPSGTNNEGDDFKWRHSRAATMLAQGIRHAAVEKGLSLRKLAARLNYRQATVLSHMAHGRVQVPLERAPDIARAVDLPVAAFLVAALEQRSPEAADLLGPVLNSAGSNGTFTTELESIAGGSLDDLGDERKRIIREVVSDRDPARRWLALAELPTVNAIREARPEFHHHGLPALDLNLIAGLLADSS